MNTQIAATVLVSTRLEKCKNYKKETVPTWREYKALPVIDNDNNNNNNNNAMLWAFHCKQKHQSTQTD